MLQYGPRRIRNLMDAQITRETLNTSIEVGVDTVFHTGDGCYYRLITRLNTAEGLLTHEKPTSALDL